MDEERPSNSPGPRGAPFNTGQQVPIPAHWLQMVTRGITNVFRRAGAPQDAPPPPGADPIAAAQQLQPMQAGPAGLGVAQPQVTAPAAPPAFPTEPAAPPPPGPQPMVQPARRDAWNSPGHSLTPIAPRDSVAGREMDYAVSLNLGATPRRQPDGRVGVTFEQLTGLADGCNLVDLAIATRQDQMAALKWSCVRKKRPNEQVRDKPDERCAQIEDFFCRPDRRLPFGTWFRELIWAVLVHDAPAIYVRKTRGGDVYALDIMDGSTIDVKIDETGRVPIAPSVAYQQVLKGSPAVNYTTDELLYWPRNLRPGRRYGRSPVEQIIMTVEIALRRDIAKMQYFTEGNVPDSLVSVPKDWSPEQITAWQTIWDHMMSDQAQKRKLKFVPGEMNVMMTRDKESLADGADEWFARVICWAFSLPPTALVRMMNRATAESAYDAALAEGLQPIIEWAKSLFDHIVQNVFGYTDLEMEPDDIRNVDPMEQQQHDMTLVERGLMSFDEFRVKAGQDPIGMDEPFIRGIGPMGGMFVSDLLKAKKMGLLMPQPQMPPDAMGGAPDAMAPGAAMPGAEQGATPNAMANELLSGVDPEILSAVGMGAKGAAGRTIDVTQGDVLDSDPLTRNGGDPKIVSLLREAERRLGKRAPVETPRRARR